MPVPPYPSSSLFVLFLSFPVLPHFPPASTSSLQLLLISLPASLPIQFLLRSSSSSLSFLTFSCFHQFPLAPTHISASLPIQFLLCSSFPVLPHFLLLPPVPSSSAYIYASFPILFPLCPSSPSLSSLTFSCFHQFPLALLILYLLPFPSSSLFVPPLLPCPPSLSPAIISPWFCCLLYNYPSWAAFCSLLPVPLPASPLFTGAPLHLMLLSL
jgi:hypothetical protein